MPIANNSISVWNKAELNVLQINNEIEMYSGIRQCCWITETVGKMGAFLHVPILLSS